MRVLNKAVYFAALSQMIDMIEPSENKSIHRTTKCIDLLCLVSMECIVLSRA